MESAPRCLANKFLFITLHFFAIQFCSTIKKGNEIDYWVSGPDKGIYLFPCRLGITIVLKKECIFIENYNRI